MPKIFLFAQLGSGVATLGKIFQMIKSMNRWKLQTINAFVGFC